MKSNLEAMQNQNEIKFVKIETELNDFIPARQMVR